MFYTCAVDGWRRSSKNCSWTCVHGIFPAGNCHIKWDDTPLHIGRDWWVALHHVCNDCIEWSLWCSKGCCPFVFCIQFFEADGTADALATYEWGGRSHGCGGGCILEEFKEHGNVRVKCYLCGDFRWEGLEIFHEEHLVIEGRLVSDVLMNGVRSWLGIAGHCVVVWFFVKQKQQNGELSIAFIENREKSIAGTLQGLLANRDGSQRGEILRGQCIIARRCNWRLWIGMKVVSLTSSSSSIPESVILLFVRTGCIFITQGICSLANKIAWRTGSCTLTFFFPLQYERILCQIYSEMLSIKLLLSTCSSCAVGHLCILCHFALTYFISVVFDGLGSYISSVSVSSIISSAAHISSK